MVPLYELVPVDLPVVLLLTDEDVVEGLVVPTVGFLWFTAVPAGAVAVMTGLRAVVLTFLPAAGLAGAAVTRVAVLLPLEEAMPDVTLLPVADSDLLILLLVPMPPLTDDPLVNTRSEPV